MGVETKIKKDMPLAPLTSFKIGGPAKYLIKVKDEEELKQAISWAKRKKVKAHILGKGTNVLISDQGIDGLVVLLDMGKIKTEGGSVKAQAGAPLSSLVDFALKSSLSGLEWAAGIPGAVGGAVRGNAGAYGQCIFDSILSVEIFNRQNFKIFTLPARGCAPGYRNSVFKKNSNLIILSALLKLKKGNRDAIRKAIKEIIKSRQAKLPKLPSAGSIFKNLSQSDLEKNNPGLFIKAEKEGIVKNKKIPAGWIINQADLAIRQIGQAKLSDEHANIIVNAGAAKAVDVTALISAIKMKIRNKFNLGLKEEIEYLGF